VEQRLEFTIAADDPVEEGSLPKCDTRPLLLADLKDPINVPSAVGAGLAPPALAAPGLVPPPLTVSSRLSQTMPWT
jgi:hypothetical protein